MTPFGFCSCKRCRHSTIVSCQSQDLQNQMHAPEEWFPRAQMFVFLWVSSLDELTRVRLFRSLLTPFFGDWPNKVGYKHMARGKRTCSVSIQPLHLCVFYLQAHCFKHRGVKQDYDSSKSVFFSAVCNNMNRLINFSKLHAVWQQYCSADPGTVQEQLSGGQQLGPGLKNLCFRLFRFVLFVKQ